MKRAWKLEGLACASCANKIETAIRALPGVTSASLGFLTQKLVIEGQDSRMDEIAKAARAIVKRHEPDVTLRSA